MEELSLLEEGNSVTYLKGKLTKVLDGQRVYCKKLRNSIFESWYSCN